MMKTNCVSRALAKSDVRLRSLQREPRQQLMKRYCSWAPRRL